MAKEKKSALKQNSVTFLSPLESAIFDEDSIEKTARPVQPSKETFADVIRELRKTSTWKSFRSSSAKTVTKSDLEFSSIYDGDATIKDAQTKALTNPKENSAKLVSNSLESISSIELAKKEADDKSMKSKLQRSHSMAKSADQGGDTARNRTFRHDSFSSRDKKGSFIDRKKVLKNGLQHESFWPKKDFLKSAAKTSEVDKVLREIDDEVFKWYKPAQQKQPVLFGFCVQHRFQQQQQPRNKSSEVAVPVSVCKQTEAGFEMCKVLSFEELNAPENNNWTNQQKPLLVPALSTPPTTETQNITSVSTACDKETNNMLYNDTGMGYPGSHHGNNVRMDQQHLDDYNNFLAVNAPDAYSGQPYKVRYQSNQLQRQQLRGPRGDRYDDYTEEINWEYEIRREREKERERERIRTMRYNYVTDYQYDYSKGYNGGREANGSRLPRLGQPGFRSRPMHRRSHMKSHPKYQGPISYTNNKAPQDRPSIVEIIDLTETKDIRHDNKDSRGHPDSNSQLNSRSFNSDSGEKSPEEHLKKFTLSSSSSINVQSNEKSQPQQPAIEVPVEVVVAQSSSAPVEVRPSQTSSVLTTESELIRDLKNQLETLRAEINNLHSIQTNLAKTLHSTAAQPPVLVENKEAEIEKELSAYLETFRAQSMSTDELNHQMSQLSSQLDNAQLNGNQFLYHHSAMTEDSFSYGNHQRGKNMNLESYHTTYNQSLDTTQVSTHNSEGQSKSNSNQRINILRKNTNDQSQSRERLAKNQPRTESKPPKHSSKSKPASRHNQSNISAADSSLHEKLLDLVTKEDKSSDEWNEEMHELLSNPEIKVHLRELHSQLVKNPDRFLANLQETLLEHQIAAQSNQAEHKQQRTNKQNLVMSCSQSNSQTFVSQTKFSSITTVSDDQVENLSRSESASSSASSSVRSAKSNMTQQDTDKLMQDLLKLHDIYGTKTQYEPELRVRNSRQSSNSRTRNAKRSSSKRY